MGGTYWSRESFEDRQEVREKSGGPVFTHDADVKAGKASGVHEALDPTKLKNGVREARDSPEHPNSVPLLFGIDVTGSQRRVPHLVQTKLGALMTTILTKGYLVDPQILFAAIGDSRDDQAPLQVGQFESGLEMDDDLTRIWIEGQGGGSGEEGYEMFLLFAARHTATDAWEKRQRKGYLFMTGDELPYTEASPDSIFRVFGGERPTKGIPLETILKEVLERYHVYFVIPAGTAHAEESNLFRTWAELLGADHVLRLRDPAQICELVALTVGLNEGTAQASVLETETPVIKEAIDPVVAGTRSKVDKARTTGAKTARL